MTINLPFTVADPTGLPALPPFWDNTLFNRSELLAWYVAEAAYITTSSYLGTTRITSWNDRTPNHQNLSQTAANSFILEAAAADLGNNSYAHSNATTLSYAWPGTWPTTDHSKIFLFKSPTPSANRFLTGAGSGEGQHRVYVSTLDRVIAEVDGATIIRTRDPSRWNLAISSWDASARVHGMLVDQEGFTTVAPVGSADCGSNVPIIGANQGGITGADNAFYREIGLLNVALHKDANADLLALIIAYFTTYYGLVLAP